MHNIKHDVQQMLPAPAGMTAHSVLFFGVADHHVRPTIHVQSRHRSNTSGGIITVSRV